MEYIDVKIKHLKQGEINNNYLSVDKNFFPENSWGSPKKEGVNFQVTTSVNDEIFQTYYDCDHSFIIDRKFPKIFYTYHKLKAGNTVYLYKINNYSYYLSTTKYDIQSTNIIEDIKNINKRKDIDKTTKKTLIDSRLGQGRFRQDLITYWKACSVTGCNLINTLIASHIKPWKHSNNVEKLDPFNGLLLMPNLDKLFDLGLISFNDNGKILLAKELSTNNKNEFNISNNIKLRNIDNKHRKYLNFHREHHGFN